MNFFDHYKNFGGLSFFVSSKQLDEIPFEDKLHILLVKLKTLNSVDLILNVFFSQGFV